MDIDLAVRRDVARLGLEVECRFFKLEKCIGFCMVDNGELAG